MSLISHYPLNGITNNVCNSNENTTISKELSIITDDSPLGKSYVFDGSAVLSIETSDVFDLIDKGIYSVTFWIKPTKTIVDNGVLSLFANFSISINPDGKLFIITNNLDLTKNPIGFTVDTNLYDDKWHNVCIMYNQNTLTVYIDKQTVSVTSDEVIFSNNNIYQKYYILDVSNSIFRYTGYIQDIRIFNNILSLNEIQEVYKTKIIHYKLDNVDFLPTVNLVPQIMRRCEGLGYSASNPTIDASIDFFAHGISDKVTIKSSYLGKTCYRYDVKYDTTSNLLCSIDLNLYGIITNDKTYSVGFSMACVATIPNSELEGYYLSLNQYIDIKPTSNWTTYYVNGGLKQQDNGILNILINPIHDIADTIFDFTVYITDLQVEEKPYASTFVDGTRNGIVPDVSGFKNNGSIALDTTPVFTPDTNLSNGAFIFDGEKSVVNTSLPSTTSLNAMTVSMWVYNTDDNDRSVLWSNYNQNNGAIGLEKTTTNRLRIIYNYANSANAYDISIPEFIIPINEWVLVTVVFDTKVSTGGIKAYKNGELIYTLSSAIQQYNLPSTTFYIGRDIRIGVTAFNGKVSDFRVYATALSDTDIKRLFNNRTIIDKMVNMTSYGFNEIESTKPSINKNGVVDCIELIESEPFEPTCIDYSTWSNQTIPPTGFVINGTTASNSIILSKNPWELDDYMWQGINDGTLEGGQNGGFVSSTFTIDPTKKYRVSCWYKRNMFSTSVNSGSIYLGCLENSVKNLSDNTVNTNPYFYYSSNTELFNENWALLVGYIFPYNYTDTIKDETSGIYYVNGKFTSANNLSGFLNFKWASDIITTSNIRCFMFYSSLLNSSLLYYRPRFEIIDTAPSIQDLVHGCEHESLYLLKDTSNKPKLSKEGKYIMKHYDETL